MIKHILAKVQKVLHEHNPCAHDFKQVIEIPSVDLKHGKIVISAKNQPKGEHAR